MDDAGILAVAQEIVQSALPSDLERVIAQGDPRVVAVVRRLLEKGVRPWPALARGTPERGRGWA